MSGNGRVFIGVSKLCPAFGGGGFGWAAVPKASFGSGGGNGGFESPGPTAAGGTGFGGVGFVASSVAGGGGTRPVLIAICRIRPSAAAGAADVRIRPAVVAARPRRSLASVLIAVFRILSPVDLPPPVPPPTGAASRAFDLRPRRRGNTKEHHGHRPSQACPIHSKKWKCTKIGQNGGAYEVEMPTSFVVEDHLIVHWQADDDGVGALNETKTTTQRRGAGHSIPQYPL